MQHLAPDPAVAQAFFQKEIKGPIVMLNLLKFKAQADYTASPELAPDSGTISGRQAYQVYMGQIKSLFDTIGSEILFMGQAEAFLIGPEAESWDAILLVKYPKKADFLAFASHEQYLKNAGHRTAALEDSRLLPMVSGSVL